ncbi:PREDICTED: kelch-like protein 10 isoform X1 [Trachymyrmex cornetzi]|uniref:Kelch-like protein 10 n=1 Tax=Trachymyrmex cornetzi TaxID=471704 RepID=A0A195DLS5_9HYME|nr:PREDICTED: kelch-like protein 10 isoform X1 [Trachymyrmex cornetzi]KYN13828.1 Kelch-like protein 10 [Trachymyrmex cornetzi]
MAARLGAIGTRVCEENEYENCWQLSGSGEAEEAIGSSGPRALTYSRHWAHVDYAITAGISKLLKQSRRKQSARIRKCMCLPSNYALVEFPVVWSELRANQQLCDGVIRCLEDQVFPVHRAILSAVSPYFKALFTNSLKGGKTETTELVISVPGEIFGLILDYAYTGTCNVNADNVEQLLPLADQFEVLGIIQLCCQFLLQELRPENCLGIFKFARHYFCHDLEKQGRKYIRHHFKRILQESAEFKDLLCDELEAILRDDELNVKNEEIVFDAVKTWVETRVEERRVYLPRLLECIRYGLMSHKYFINNIINWKLVEKDEACQQILFPVNAYLTEQELKQNGEIDLKNPIARPRVPYEILFAIGGWSAGSPTSFVETYDTRADRWFLSVNTDVTPRAYHGLCVLNNLIYMIGGFDGNEHFNTVRCFDPTTKTWRERACMYHARCYVSVCTHGGKIYALGGYNGRTRMSSGERYDPQRNQWEMIPSMHRQRSDASAAALHDKIYIVGGFNGQEVLDSAEVFDVETSQWTNIDSMISPRSGVSLVAFRDSLYALGGFSGVARLNSGERYTPNHSDQWHEISEMFSPRSNFATVILDDMIFVIGGYNGSSTIAHVECYDADYNEWYDASPMNLSRSALSACVIAGLANAREYSYLGKARDLGQGQATSKNQEKSDQPGEGSAGISSNVIISAQDDEQTDVSESMHVVGPIDGMADGIGNFYEEENGNDEKEMQSELLYVVNELD